MKKVSSKNRKQWLDCYEMMYTSCCMTSLYEEETKLTSKYVHATSRGHEAIQIAAGYFLKPYDFAFPYYRDDALLLSMKVTPYELMLQLLGKQEDPFSGGRTYYSHPSLRDDDRVKIPHQSSATGMQAIPATGVALGLQYKEKVKLHTKRQFPVVLCSLGDASITEGEVSEAFQMAALKQLPIIYLIQDNGWDISAKAEEIRAQNALEFAEGFKGLEAVSIKGNDMIDCLTKMEAVVKTVRKERRPILVHAKVPLLNHHTSGVRMEWYRDDLEEDKKEDPQPLLRAQLIKKGVIKEKALIKIEKKIEARVREQYEQAVSAKDPDPEDIFKHVFAETPVIEEKGERAPEEGTEKVMVDSALLAIEELMHADPACLLYGQDVGKRLGGVFREAATLGDKFGDHRVFNTPIQEAFIVGSTVGMSAVGLKPIVEVQFADYIWPGLNQLFTEVSRSYYLSNGKWPVSMILRVPIGAYGSGGPYHSSSVESILTSIKGIKIVYPSNGADMKGLMKAAYHDPNPVVILEHKGLYWSKVPGTLAARRIEPSEDYLLPLGIADITLEANAESIENGDSLLVVTYGMGVHWALNAAKNLEGQVSILDLRTLCPLDEKMIFAQAKKHGRVMVLTEEAVELSFAMSLAGKIQEQCFQHLDAPVLTIGAENLPAIGLSSILEQSMLPNAEKVLAKMKYLLKY